MFFGLLVLLVLFGCGASNSGMDNASSSSEQKAQGETAPAGDADKKASSETKEKSPASMMVYTAELSLTVKDFATAQQHITALAEKKNGYVVEAQSYTQGAGPNLLQGDFRIRIPSAHFTAFLDEVEKLSSRVVSRTIQGRDVTEEYVDLEARLSSKQVMEAQLLGFMKQAQKTEDVLKIAHDLNQVQTEIEQLKGKIKYLKNQVAFSTISLHVTENKAVVPSLSGDSVSAWDQIKQRFMQSIAFLLDAATALFVFVIGFSPLLCIVAAIVAIVLYRRKKKGNSKSL